MKAAQERVRSLEQQETGEIRRLSCPACGLRSFLSLQQLDHHEAVCLQARARQLQELKAP